VEDFDETVVVPEAYPRDVLGWVEDAGRRKSLSRLLAVPLEEGTTAGIFHGGRTWTGRTGRSEWIPHGDPIPTTGARPSPLPKIVLGAGLAMAVAGGVTAGVGYAAAKPANDTSTLTDRQVWRTHRTVYWTG
jgi:hypothetical protein